MKLFSVLDVKAQSFAKPFCDESAVNALRGFSRVVNEGNNPLHDFPDDFCLCEMGDFDPQSGKLSPAASPINLGSARTVLRAAEVVKQ